MYEHTYIPIFGNRKKETRNRNDLRKTDDG